MYEVVCESPTDILASGSASVAPSACPLDRPRSLQRGGQGAPADGPADQHPLSDRPGIRERAGRACSQSLGGPGMRMVPWRSSSSWNSGRRRATTAAPAGPPAPPPRPTRARAGRGVPPPCAPGGGGGASAGRVAASGWRRGTALPPPPGLTVPRWAPAQPIVSYMSDC
jgi:hypothetical protein